ncbi:MAG TPA: CBS domain-containing protein [Bacteroidia bacterium]|nr:CBS domain-containing protein [Bacteroidia bacterium]HNT79716.1 CBS domain-containing protein [Bacteroidia bacterium]
MTIKDLIRDTVPSLKLSDSGVKVLNWMESFQVRHLPVVDNGNYLGLISDNDILSSSDPVLPIHSYNLSLLQPFLFEHQHLFDAIKFVSNSHYTVVPILNEEKKFIGLITMFDIIDAIAVYHSVREHGGIIEVELKGNDYLLSDLIKIVESCESSVLSINVVETSKIGSTVISIKVNKVDLSKLLAAFYRKDIQVISTFNHVDISGDLQNRYDSFMNYLSI